MELATLVICFLTLMVMSVPIAYNLILSSLAYMLVSDVPVVIIAQKMYEGMNSFSFLAVPFFVPYGAADAQGETARIPY